MREILFRGRHLYDGKWKEGNLFIHDKSESYEIFVGNKSYTISWEVDPETVGQWTGLVDKNEVKVFEGDIVKTDKFSEQNKTYIIKYDLQFGAFIGEDEYGVWFFTFDGDSDQFEVISNIHDKAVEE